MPVSQTPNVPGAEVSDEPGSGQWTGYMDCIESVLAEQIRFQGEPLWRDEDGPGPKAAGRLGEQAGRRSFGESKDDWKDLSQVMAG